MNTDLHSSLQTHFGFADFRPGQKVIHYSLPGSFVLDHATMPEGNRLLLQKGAVPFPHPFPEHFNKLPGWLLENSAPPRPNATQLGLF